MSGLALATYNNFSEEKKLETDAQKAVDLLNLARKKALAGDAYISGTQYCTVGNEDFLAYRVRLGQNSSSLPLRYFARIICVSGPAPLLYPDLNLSSGNKFTADTVVNFRKISGATWFDIGNSSTPSIIKNTIINKCINITISDSGVISIGQSYSC